jgi:autotransporter-associated beta strand protein
MRKISVSAIATALFLAAMPVGFAGTQKDFFQNSDLNDGNNYNPAGLPSSANDVLLTTSATGLQLSGAGFFNIGTLNQNNTAAYTISNNTSGSTSSSLILNGGTNTVGANPNDLIYLGGATSSLTLQGANGGTGSGILAVGVNQSGNLDVAQANAVLNISASFDTGTSHVVAKTGAGTLNVSNFFGGMGAIEVDEGTMNFLPGASMSNDGLIANNPNTGPATAVNLNVQTFIFARGLAGTIAAASSGTNTATVNVQGAATELSLFANSAVTSQYNGDITGDGSVSVGAPQSGSGQVFTGHNTYTGTTTLSGGTLRIDGTTSGQGNYTVMGSSVTAATLRGSGTIGLAANGTVTIGGGNSQSSNLAPGPNSGIGTLHVVTSGTGKVVFSDSSTFLVDIGPGGANDQLAITGGKIDLTSSTDALSLNNLGGGFDGASYTIATFASSSNYGVFNTVTGLPANYGVVYNPTSIILVAVPEPTMVTLFCVGTALSFTGRVRKRKI